MIEGLKPYAKYKESGQEWLGRVPAHWRTPRIKTVLREKDARSLDGSGLLLSLTRNRGLIDRSDMTDKIHSARTLAGYKLYEPGEIVMNRMQAWSGMFGAGNKPGLVSPDYAVFKLLGRDLVSLLLARIKAPDLVSQFALESKGIGSGFNRLYSDKFGAIAISLPPPDEQAAIVRFLDHANRKIDGFIRAKRKLIGLLNEQKQAIIHRAVTRGLHPDAPLKPSGIPWLGDIPKHWDVLRAKYLFREVDDRSKEGKETHLAMSQRLGLVPSNMVESAMRSESYAGAKLCQEGDLVLNRLKAHLGVFALAKQGGVISPDYSVFRKRAVICMEYYESVLRSSACRRELRIRAKGLVESFWRLYTDDFYDIRLPVPPPDEQREIMSAMTVETAPLTTAIARTEREIALMQEYRTRLTADLVTGKLDVREAAAKLPEVPADGTTELEINVLDDTSDSDINPSEEI
jgi:type I restriction enzyme S subunit